MTKENKSLKVKTSSRRKFFKTAAKTGAIAAAAVAMPYVKANAATTLNIRSVQTAWTGLRTFAPDRSMVIGPDSDDRSFFWCVGQGGTGIMTSPGAGRLLADLLTVGNPSEYFDKTGLKHEDVSPDRFRKK